MVSSPNPLICALDTPDVAHAAALFTALQGQVGAVKLGLEFFCAHGPQGVRQVLGETGMPLFLDLKFHDIPHTVARAVKAAASVKPLLMTVHACGGKAMLRAAAEAADEAAQKNGQKTHLLAVTVLTSLDQEDLAHAGVTASVEDQVRRLAKLAQNSGMSGVICSPHEIAMLRRECGPDFLLVVPGIRPDGSDHGDQKRVLSPRAALAEGADYLVIGRPITAAADPAAAAAAIARDVQQTHAA